LNRNTLLGGLGAAGGTFAVGSAVAVSAELDDYPVLGGQAVRYALAALVLVALLRLRGPLPRPDGRATALLAALAATGLAGFNVCLIGALREADPAVVGVIVGTAPVVLAIAGPLLAGAPPAARVLAAAVIVTLGAAIVQGTGEATTTGILLAVGALAGEVGFSLLAVPVLPRLGPLGLSAYVCVLAAVMLAPTAALLDGAGALPTPDAAELGALAYLVGVVTVGGFLAWYGGVARLRVDRAGLFLGLIPVTALAVAAGLGSDTITPLKAFGALMVGGGVAFGVSAAPAAPLEHEGAVG
jgi:drug/metabolite transporter (DMT)-like permease